MKTQKYEKSVTSPPPPNRIQQTGSQKQGNAQWAKPSGVYHKQDPLPSEQEDVGKEREEVLSLVTGRPAGGGGTASMAPARRWRQMQSQMPPGTHTSSVLKT